MTLTKALPQGGWEWEESDVEEEEGAEGKVEGDAGVCRGGEWVGLLRAALEDGDLAAVLRLCYGSVKALLRLC
jgi:hypothetical protein